MSADTNHGYGVRDLCRKRKALECHAHVTDLLPCEGLRRRRRSAYGITVRIPFDAPDEPLLRMSCKPNLEFLRDSRFVDRPVSFRAGDSRHDAAFARELPRFLAAVWRVFDEHELAGFVANQKPGYTQASAHAPLLLLNPGEGPAGSLRHVEDEQDRRKTKRELREENRARRSARMRNDSIGVVYKRLVKVLPPDLESDAAGRQKKIRMMQEVTAAYARSDLHTLLRLELECIDGAQADAARLGSERLRAYTEFLKERAAELEAECRVLRFHPKYAALMVDGPFDLPMLIDGPSEAARLDLVIEEVRIGIEQMASSQALQQVRRAIQEYRRVQKARRKQ